MSYTLPNLNKKSTHDMVYLGMASYIFLWFSVVSRGTKGKRPDLRSMALTQILTRSDKDMTKLRCLLRQIYRKWLENDQMIPEYS